MKEVRLYGMHFYILNRCAWLRSRLQTFCLFAAAAGCISFVMPEGSGAAPYLLADLCLLAGMFLLWLDAAIRYQSYKKRGLV